MRREKTKINANIERINISQEKKGTLEHPWSVQANIYSNPKTRTDRFLASFSKTRKKKKTDERQNQL